MRRVKVNGQPIPVEVVVHTSWRVHVRRIAVGVRAHDSAARQVDVIPAPVVVVGVLAASMFVKGDVSDDCTVI